jgi:hypothetical protein
MLVAAPAADAAHRSRPHDNEAGKTRSTLKRKAKRPAARAARTDARTKPVYFVHGLDAFGTAGNDCAGTWSNMANTLRAWGWTGALTTVKYYHGDTNCSAALDGYGSHSTHFPRTDAHQNGSHDMDGDIRHLAYHLAWMIYARDSQHGRAVDAVGHSMGGLILRYMAHRIQANDPDFPPYLYLEDVVTLGTPHTGSGYAGWCGWAFECNQMNNGSSFITYLASNAPNPQADGGTDWTTIGSYDDGFVSEGSAVSMSAAHKVRYLGSMDIGHSDYQQRTSDARTADVEYWDTPGPWYAWYDAPYPVRWSDSALLYGSW